MPGSWLALMYRVKESQGTGQFPRRLAALDQ